MSAPDRISWDPIGKIARLRFDDVTSTWRLIHELLEFSYRREDLADISEEIVASVLELRIGGAGVKRKASTDQPKDWIQYTVSDTHFYVSTAPSLNQLSVELLAHRPEDEVYILVPDRILRATQQAAELGIDKHFTLQSIESFAAISLDLASAFSPQLRLRVFLRFIKAVNSRARCHVNRPHSVQLCFDGKETRPYGLN